MIISFKDKETEKLWNGILTKRIPPAIKQKALIKLHAINIALSIRDLEEPFSNRLEALKGDRLGQYSIRINQQWRICFEWDNGKASNVEIVDYH